MNPPKTGTGSAARKESRRLPAALFVLACVLLLPAGLTYFLAPDTSLPTILSIASFLCAAWVTLLLRGQKKGRRPGAAEEREHARPGSGPESGGTLTESSPADRQSVLDDLPEGMVVVQEDIIVFANPSAAMMFGYPSPAAMAGVRFQDIIAPASRSFWNPSPGSRERGDVIIRNEYTKGLTRRGSVFDLEGSAAVTVWNGEPAVQAVFRDVTQRKELERHQAQWFWEQDMLTAIDRQLGTALDLDSVLDLIVYHARALTRADWAGVLVFDEARNEAEWRAIRGSLATGKGIRLPMDAVAPLLRSGDEVVLLSDAPGVLGERCGDLFALDSARVESAACFPLRAEARSLGRLVLVFHRRHDFTDREQRLLTHMAERSSLALAHAELYEKQRRHEEELQQLTEARVHAQESERRRLARELHDGLGQILTAIKFNVEVLEDAKNLSDEDRKQLAGIRELLEGAMSETREISHNLMPSVLDDFGLTPAVQLLCDQTASASGLRVQCQVHGTIERLPADVETGLFRVVQEALNNVVKHADATNVDVQLIADEKSLRLTVADDGKGFEVEVVRRQIRPQQGMGLLSMRERAAALGGMLAIESHPGRGTEILIELPSHRKETA